MSRFVRPTILIGVLCFAARAQNDDNTRPHWTKTDGSTESGWAVQVPTGSSDWFNVRYDTATPVTVEGLGVAVCDFGGTNTYPIVGCYASNMALDPSGNTPDLSQPFVVVASPPILTGSRGDHVSIDTPATAIPAGAFHVAIQLPPGDPGLVRMDADSILDESHPTLDLRAYPRMR